MKKFILSFAVVALVFGGLLACGEQTKWNREERQAMRNILRDYRKMVYLENLTEAEYMLFADQVISAVEGSGIVYERTREGCEKLADRLNNNGIRANLQMHS